MADRSGMQSLLLDSPSSGSEVPDLELIPPPNKTKKKVRLKRAMPKLSKLNNGVSIADPNKSSDSTELVLPRSWLVCQCLVLLVLGVGLVTLAMYTLSIRHDLLQLQTALHNLSLTNGAQPMDFQSSQMPHQLSGSAGAASNPAGVDKDYDNRMTKLTSELHDLNAWQKNTQVKLSKLEDLPSRLDQLAREIESHPPPDAHTGETVEKTVKRLMQTYHEDFDARLSELNRQVTDLQSKYEDLKSQRQSENSELTGLLKTSVPGHNNLPKLQPREPTNPPESESPADDAGKSGPPPDARLPAAIPKTTPETSAGGLTNSPASSSQSRSTTDLPPPNQSNKTETGDPAKSETAKIAGTNSGGPDTENPLFSVPQKEKDGDKETENSNNMESNPDIVQPARKRVPGGKP